MPTGEKVRFLHSSDWQLGMTRAFLSREAAPRFNQARIDAIVRLGELASIHSAAFIVVAGDVFESNQVSRQTLLRAVDALARVSVPVFLLPGNHDPLDASSLFLSAELSRAGEHIIVIRDTRPIAVPGRPDVEVAGAPWRSKHPSADLCASLLRDLEPTTTALRIAVCHGQVDTLAPDNSRPEIIDLAQAEAAVKDGRIHYLALGDRHSTTRIGVTDRIWYSGAPVATAFDESDPNNALLVELDRAGQCGVEVLPVGNWKFVAAQHDLNGAEDLDRLERWLSALPAKERSIVKLGLTGTLSLAAAARLDEILDHHAALFASLRRRERTSNLVVEADQLDQDSVSLGGYARRAWDELMQDAPGDPVARQALRLLYRISSRAGQR
jgi:DNA repair exonuclease SbcCD nuclease subunit